MDPPKSQRALLRFLLQDKSAEELAELAVDLSDENITLQAQVLELMERVRSLEDRVGVDSSNSHLPPSSDPPGSKKRKKRKGSGKKRGGQPGHKGTNRKMVAADQVDHLEDVRPSSCRDCGGHVGPSGEPPVRHQVWELPAEILAAVTEYRLHALFCPACQKNTRAKLPDDVPSGAFGTRVQGAVAYLSGALRLSDRQVADLLDQLFGLKMAIGTVANIRKGVSKALAVPSAEALAYIQKQPVVHADETTWREEDGLSWLWVAVTPLVSAFRIQAGRGKWEAAQLLGESFSGVLVCDRLYSYLWVKHRQVCWAHLVRDFRRIAGRAGMPGHLGRQMEELGEEVLRLARRVRSGDLAHSSMRTYMVPIRKRLKELLEAGVDAAHKKTAGTCRQILKVERFLWAFTRNPNVDPTNNTAERAIRPAVIWRRTRQGTKSIAGALFVERVMTVVETLKKQGRSALAYLEAAVHARLVGQPAPSLLPA